MLFNEYLDFRLGAVFENKYNRLAVLEIKENFDSYKDYIRLDLDQLDEILETNNFEGYGFDGDDPETEPSVEEGLMLLRAFIMAFLKENKDNNKLKLRSIEFGKGYLEDKHTYLVKNAFYRYNGYKSLYISNNNVVISEKYFNPVTDYQKTTEERRYFYHNNNKDILDFILKDGMKQTLSYCYNKSIFDDDNLSFECINGKPSYVYWHYIYDFGKNIIPIYTTEMGFDGFCLVRSKMKEAIIDEYKRNDIVTNLERW